MWDGDDYHVSFDVDSLKFLRIIKESDKAILFKTTEEVAVWIPKSQITEIDRIKGEVEYYDVFTLGGKNGEFVVNLTEEV